MGKIVGKGGLSMRRKDREKSSEFAYGVFDEAPFATLSMIAEGKPYGIPISPARREDVFYFHCAKEGRKVDAFCENNEISLSAVSRWEPVPLDFSLEYASAVATGKVLLVEDEREKREALRLITERYSPEDLKLFEDYVKTAMDVTAVYKFSVQDITGKARERIKK